MRQWKVGSITLGFTLIFLGIIFLIGTFVDLSLVGRFIKFWPFIFIFLGVEILLCQFLSNKAHEKFRITGSSIFMFIILIFICGGLFITSNILTFNKDGIHFNNFHKINYKLTERFNKSYKVQRKNADTINIESNIGNIYIDKSQTDNIEVKAKGTIYGNNKKTMASAIDSLVNIDEGSTINITTDEMYQENNGPVSADLYLYIKIPPKMYAKVSNSYGNINLTNLTKGAKVSSDNGNISIKNITGDLDLKNSYGATTVNSIKGNVDTTSENGNVIINDVSGYLNASNSYGDIKLKNVLGKIDAYATNGKISLTSSNPLTKGLNLKSEYGAIDINLPKKQAGNFDLKTEYGKISNDFGLSVQKDEDSNKQSSNKKIGNSDIPIKISSDNGDIDLRAN